jgi:hypothetical protein
LAPQGGQAQVGFALKQAWRIAQPAQADNQQSRAEFEHVAAFRFPSLEVK